MTDLPKPPSKELKATVELLDHTFDVLVEMRDSINKLLEVIDTQLDDLAWVERGVMMSDLPKPQLVQLANHEDCENSNGHVAEVNPICMFCGAKLKCVRPAVDIETLKQQIADVLDQEDKNDSEGEGRLVNLLVADKILGLLDPKGEQDG